ncbi:MAG: ferredoxin-NADP reductase [Arenicella sp.]|jgi:ferredoxin-NADP reductase
MLKENTLDVLIDSREDQGDGVAVLRLVSANGEALPVFSAGAHIDVQINKQLVRQYSLSNAPGDADHYRIGVLNDPQSRGGSVTLFSEFQAGKKIQISSPRNHFEVQTHDGKAILIAGGIGITPIVSMAYELRQQHRHFEIHYCLNKQSSGAFVEELQAEFSEQLRLHCSVDKKVNPIEVLSGNKSRLSDAAHLYVCGPTGFMDWVIDSAKKQGFGSSQIHFEYFSADVELDGHAIEVYCSESDTTVMVAPNQTIATALSLAGIKVDVSCQQGVCGTCITEVLEGEPDHRDQFLTDDEKQDNDQMAVCCSRAKSARLVLEV